MTTRRPKIASVTTLKAPVDQVLQFAAYHHHLGLDEIILFFDDPEDSAIDAVKSKPGVTAIPCDDEHWHQVRDPRPEFVQHRQLANVNWVLRERRHDLDWLIHIDSDELIYAPDGLKESVAVEDDGLSVLRLRPLEAIPPSPDMSDPFLEVRWFKQHDPKDPEAKSRAEKWGVASGFQGKRFLRGHTSGKIAVKLDGVVSRVLLHQPTIYDEQEMRSVTSSRLWVLHYDAGSFDQWYDKWHDRSGFEQSGFRGHRMKHLKRFRKLDRAGDTAGLKKMYRDSHMLPKWQLPILQRLGLVRRVKLPKKNFCWEANPGDKSG